MTQQTLALIKPDDERITALDNVFKECGLVAGGNPFAKMIAYANAVAKARTAIPGRAVAVRMVFASRTSYGRSLKLGM